jgi:hypothetical protein
MIRSTALPSLLLLGAIHSSMIASPPRQEPFSVEWVPRPNPASSSPGQSIPNARIDCEQGGQAWCSWDFAFSGDIHGPAPGQDPDDPIRGIVIQKATSNIWWSTCGSPSSSDSESTEFYELWWVIVDESTGLPRTVHPNPYEGGGAWIDSPGDTFISFGVQGLEGRCEQLGEATFLPLTEETEPYFGEILGLFDSPLNEPAPPPSPPLADPPPVVIGPPECSIPGFVVGDWEFNAVSGTSTWVPKAHRIPSTTFGTPWQWLQTTPSPNTAHVPDPTPPPGGGQPITFPTYGGHAVQMALHSLTVDFLCCGTDDDFLQPRRTP